MNRTGPFRLIFGLVVLICFGQCLGQITTDSNPSSRWPMQLDTPAGQLTIYQPQPTNFDGDTLSGRAAVSLLKQGASDPVFGAIWMESRVATDRVNRTVEILDVNVTRVHFPTDTDVTAETITDALRVAMPAHQMSLSLDQLLAMVEEVEQEKQSVAQISDTPPRIIFQTHPGVLLQYDGQPRFTQVSNSQLLRADNTPFYVVQDPASQTYFLKGAGRWFSARNPMGPYQLTGSVPQPVAALADSSGYQDPDKPLTDQQAAQMEIVAATEPTELIWTDGPIQMGTIPNTNLLYVMNTDSDVFREIDTQAWYVLLSGRWYSAPKQDGPWTYVASDKLPDDFKRIPPASAKSEVLASVAGTQQAQDAVADTFVPQTAAIDRNHFDQPPVTYDGNPDFQPVEGTAMQYAVNTPDSVLLVNGQYYCCYNGVWYNSAVANGPWGLCTAVPAVIYTLPPSCPLFPCRYCYVYGVTPEYCYVGYTPGYTGCFRHDHVVIYGTGWHYHPWIGHHFYARPFTYGFAARYDPYTGFWGFHIGIHADDGFVWVGAHEHPIVRPAWFGHGGFRPPVVAHDIYVHRDIYQRIGARPGMWNLYAERHDVHPEGPRNPEFGRSVAHPEQHPVTNIHEQTRMVTPNEHHEDLYADPNGNVFRRTDKGWEQREANRWVNTPEAPDRDRVHAQEQQSRQEPTRTQTPNQQTPARVEAPRETPREQQPVRTEQPRQEEPALNRDFQARQFGEDRAQMFQRSESGGGGGGSQRSAGPSGGGGGGGGYQRSAGPSNGGGGGATVQQTGPHR